MQQPLTRSVSQVPHRAHTDSAAKSEGEDPGVGWKVAACVVGGYLTIISIIATGMLIVYGLAAMFGAYNRNIGW